MTRATALASPNIAFIKYWGNLDAPLRVPANSSLSMNLASLHSTTKVTFNPALNQDILVLNGKTAEEAAARRVSTFLDRVRALAGFQHPAEVVSENNFPTGAGIASSASAFAALALAASQAAGLTLDEKALSRLARTGSGSACRSVPPGFVEWQAGDADENSYAFSIAPPDHWDLIDCIAVITEQHKPTGSTQGHALAATSPLQAGRIADTDRRLKICREAILRRDFEAFAEITELDCNLMHAVMMTSSPLLFYWEPITLELMHTVRSWRATGLPVCYTIDAGPNVHVITLAAYAGQVSDLLREIPGIQQVLMSPPGGAAHLV
ncbi:MAG: diphosphomevalonate decarboxylase [Anaerolineales bacterium]